VRRRGTSPCVAELRAARHGLKTVLLEPRDHPGGMESGGLSRTDVGRHQVLGGLALEFYARVGIRSDIRRFQQRAAWFHELTLIAPIPDRKADFNNQGPFSTAYIGKNYDCPNGDYKRRAEIWEDHVRYVQGYYHFLANDPRVPATLRAEVN
jgi:hypothetical protein